MTFHIDYDFRTAFKLQTVSISSVVLYKDLKILYSHEKRKLSNGQLWKIWKKTTFIELCFFFLDLLAFELGKFCPGVGTFVLFLRPGGQSFALNSCPGGGDFDGKDQWPGGQPGAGGMVTGQIDTCIRFKRNFKCTLWTNRLLETSEICFGECL